MTRLSAAHPLSREFFHRPVLELAPLLLGCVLVGRGVALRITEVEAYNGSDDPGSHAFRGLTRHNATMFGPPGHLYVYRHMGLHSCMNVVADAEGIGTGCLLRAGEVLAGVDVAWERRRASGVCRAERDLARGPGRATVACGVTWQDDGLDLCGEAPSAPFHGTPVPEISLHPSAAGPSGGEPPSALSPALSLLHSSGFRIVGRIAEADHPSAEASPHLTTAPTAPHPLLATGPRIGLREEASDPQRFPWRFRIAGDRTVSGPGALNR